MYFSIHLLRAKVEDCHLKIGGMIISETKQIVLGAPPHPLLHPFSGRRETMTQALLCHQRTRVCVCNYQHNCGAITNSCGSITWFSNRCGLLGLLGGGANTSVDGAISLLNLDSHDALDPLSSSPTLSLSLCRWSFLAMTVQNVY